MRAGDVVAGRFELEAHARTGGMGTVYCARDLLSGERVALKLLSHPGGRDDERFAREARVLAELSHPAIVRYVEHGTTPQREPYLVMEWIEGEDLADRLVRAPTSVAEALTIARRAAAGLAVAHARGIVHRDVKPSNVLLPGCDVARAKLVDFGVARTSNTTFARTMTGALIGTPGYMAPEQALSDQVIDARADVFALGCVLFECLVHRPAFAAEHLMGLLAKIVLDQAPRLRDVRPDLPEALDDLLAQMLSNDRRGRPSDGAAVVAAIDALGSFTEDGVPPRPSSTAARITDREQRFVSVVVAGTEPTRASLEDADTLAEGVATGTLETVRLAVASLGTRFEWLADGSLVGAVGGRGAATDEATQAARCALAVRARLANVPIAVTTGRSVVAGRLPMGEAIDRASRLLRAPSVAGAAIRIDEVTAGLLDSRFEVAGDDFGLVLVGERSAGEAPRRLLGLETPCVGRERELHLLEGSFAECVAEPMALSVIVTAPAGFGKSRVRDELVRRLERRGDPVEVWLSRGDPMSAGSPFALLSRALRRACGLLGGESAATERHKIRARVARRVPEGEVARVAEFLGELTGVSFPDDESVQLKAARSEPMLMGDQMRRAWEDFLAAETAAQPVLLVLEDLHWGDLPTVRFVDGALRNLAERPFMVVALARPEVHDLFPRLWHERRTQEVRLEELPRRASERLVRAVLGESVAPTTVGQLVARSGGNAFYLEELIRAVAGGQGDSLPPTVLAMAQARLDALDAEERRFLRAASVFGDTFWLGGVQALLGARSTPTRASDLLDVLVAHELVTPHSHSRLAHQQELAFRHALVREAAYASFTDADRTLGHKLAAIWLEKAGERDPITLAEHYERGGDPASALLSYLDAAYHALLGNDFAAAISRAERGLACGADREILGAFELLAAEAHRWIGAFAEGRRCAEHAVRELPRGSPLWIAAVGELGSAAGLVGDHLRLVTLSDELRDVGEHAGVTPALAIAGARVAVQLYHAGKYPMADALLAWLEELASPLASAHPAVAGWLGRARTIQASKRGDVARCLQAAEVSAIALESAGDLRTACLQRMNQAFAANELGLFAQAEQTLRAALSEASRMGLSHVTAPGKTFLGYALVGLARYSEAIAVEREAAALFAKQGDRRMEAASLNHLARALLGVGDTAGAEAAARAGVERCGGLPAMKATSLGTLAAVLLERGAGQGALEASAEGMTILTSLGAIDQGEARLRLAHAEALAATGDAEGGRSAAVAARTCLEARAASIPDAQWRSSFLGAVPENARTMALAAGRDRER